MGRLFGTDGVRGIANEELTCKLAFKIGQASALVLTETLKHKPTILIGKDTRLSGDMLEASLASGICSVGADVKSLGVIPTPAVAYLTRFYNADAGIVISASHNPMEYNGIKIFDCDGNKLSDAIEERIEAIILDKSEPIPVITGSDLGRVKHADSAINDYVSFLCSAVNDDFSGLKIAVDCANGAASATAGILFSRLKTEFCLINCNPDGTNINEKCGSTNIESLSKKVVSGKFDLGIAFDGDADRCLIVDENGELVDGDKIIAICACEMKKQGKLKNDTAVVTVMSNMGFYKMAKQNGINVIAASVGDRYVLEEMKRGGHNLGGEQSGHIIFLDHNTTGDGQLTAIKLLSIIKKSGQKMSQVASVMAVYPQILINVTVKNDAKELYANDDAFLAAVSMAEESLAGDGRVLVRPSGTEPLIRVMIEGPDIKQIEELANSIALAIREKFGV